MGFVLSKILWYPADYGKPDDATGLSRAEKEIIQHSWKLFKADSKKNGVYLFQKLFDRYPEYQRLFKAFASVPRDKLPANGRLLGHATSVMYSMTSLVDNLDDAECLVELLHKIGVSHKRWNLTAEHFQALQIILLSSLEDVLGSSVMNSKAKEAWNKLIGVANGVIIKALDSSD